MVLEPTVLDQVLLHLEEAKLIFRREKADLRDATFTFSHALLQEAAYDSILKAQRQQMHIRSAEALLRTTPSIAKSKPELLAHHFARAEAGQMAFEWWGKAGEHALKQGAYAEAAAHFKKALDIPIPQETTMMSCACVFSWRLATL